jgi:pyruvate/2-oxoglutarate dehydrogenase complex dihydrolipoamide acyltransferase (E2) component
MPRGRPRKNPGDVLIKSAELIGWALGGIEREIVETRHRLSALTAQANQLRARIRAKGASAAAAPAAAPADADTPERRKRRRRRNLSPEARKRISDRMKKRWAEYRKNKGKS